MTELQFIALERWLDAKLLAERDASAENIKTMQESRENLVSLLRVPDSAREKQYSCSIPEARIRAIFHEEHSDAHVLNRPFTI